MPVIFSRSNSSSSSGKGSGYGFADKVWALYLYGLCYLVPFHCPMELLPKKNVFNFVVITSY